MKNDRARLRRSIYITLSFVVLIWLVKIAEHTFGLDFSELGIYPRSVKGSLGIVTGPLVHGDIFHLLSNTFPILVLGIGLFYFYDRIAWYVLGLIYVITGFWVWLAAREAYHVGASGLIYGMLTFLLFSGFFRRDRRTLAMSFIVLFLYGTTLFTGIIPSKPDISWESHLMGAIAGLFCAIYFKKTPVSDELPKVEETTSKEPEFPVYTYHLTSTDDTGSGTQQPQKYTYTIIRESGLRKD